jgi:hypothetical protein
MMECEKIGDLFAELHDEELHGETAKTAREHLRNCPYCREDFKWYGITVQALTGLERVQPPPGFLNQLHSTIHTNPPSYSLLHSLKSFFSFFPHLPLPVGATALTFVVAVAWAVYSYTPGVMPWVPGNQTVGIQPGSTAEKARVNEASAMVKAYDPTRVPLDGRHVPSGAGIPKSFNSSPMILPAATNSIGTDNLTVESPSINLAVESLKKVLPDLKGQVVEEQSRDGVGETTLAVVIPPQAWPHLTAELINHGAVAVGNSQSGETAASADRESRSVLIRIRIVHTR